MHVFGRNVKVSALIFEVIIVAVIANVTVSVASPVVVDRAFFDILLLGFTRPALVIE